MVSFLRRRPFLLEIRDIWPDFLIDMGILRNKALIRVFRILEKFLYNRAILIIVNSPAYAPILVEKGVPGDKIELVSNGVEIRMFDPMATGEAFREEQGLKGKFLGVYAGALGKANDIWTILEAAQVLRDNQRIRLVLVGDGMERKELEMAAKQRGLDNLIFTGAQPKMKIPEILAASDLCMATLMDIPMFRTTFPNKVFDYMAAGRPIALAIDGVIREVVEKADCGLCVPPGDGRALAEAMEWMEQNHESAKRMGLAGRAYVAEHYDRGKLAKKLIHIIESIH
jgi:glycosyltransferase involved in cell wall biosynthesis